MSFTSSMLSLGASYNKSMKKNQPEILFGCGIIGVLCGIGYSIYGTTKQTKTINNANTQVLLVKERKENKEITEEVETKELGDIRKQVVISTVKNYAPVIILSSLGIGCLVGSHIELKKRNATLMLAYVTLSKSFDIYRENVRKAEGIEADQRYLHGNVREELVQNPETGKTELVKKNDMKSASLFEITIDPASPLCQRSTMYTKNAVLGQLNAVNQLAREDGFISWNQIRRLFYEKSYDRKDPRWELGQRLGIIWDKDNTNPYQIDGGLYDKLEDGTRVHADFLDASQQHNCITLKFDCVYLGETNSDLN